MSIYAEYDRSDWEAIGGWSGVEPYVDVLSLLFRDDCDEDELESDPEVRTETPVESESRLVCIEVSRERYYRVFERESGNGWLMVEHGSKVFTERQYTTVGGAA